ncbi:MAG: hypothetical protein IJ499_04565 [Clostridia bacterium]|nr:hypothetical protein [Clostridia bacterium]
MKRVLITFFLAVLLCSCGRQEEARFFDYQDGEIDLECVIVYNGHENKVEIAASAPDESGVREKISVRYVSPEMIEGYTLEKNGGEYVGKMGSVEIPFGETVAGVVKYIDMAFSLNEDMISNITAAENGLTEATVLSEELSGTVTTDSNGAPIKLDLSFSDGKTLVLSISGEE